MKQPRRMSVIIINNIIINNIIINNIKNNVAVGRLLRSEWWLLTLAGVSEIIMSA